MFLFGKKKEKKEKNIEVNIKVNKDELIAEASEKIQELEELSGEQRVQKFFLQFMGINLIKKMLL